MKTAIVTITTGAKYNALAEVTHPTILTYALKIGAEFIVWRDTSKHQIPAYQKLEIGGLLEKYDRVAYIDTDIIIRPDAPNIFDIVPETHVGMFEEGAFMDRRGAMKALVNDVEWVTRGTYYNAGVVVVSKIHRDIFVQPTIEVDNFMDQTYLNYMLYKSGHPVFNLPYRFNRMIWLDRSGENRLDSYFLHYAGVLSNGVDAIEQVKEDRERWRLDSWNESSYRYPRKIHFTVRGGFGDQVCAEPVLRYVKETIYRDDQVIVHTDHPELFTHLDVELHKFGEVLNSYGIYCIDLTPTTSDRNLNFSLMHQTDYASLKTFGGILPSEKKVIQLPDYREYAPECVDERTVLIHASKWWPTKTFPEEFWSMVASTAVELGMDPVFIGKTSVDGPSVISVDGFNSVVDETDTKSLIGAIQKARFLITTDSAPLHLAGSSACSVGLVSPIRQPWTLLPTRSTGVSAAEVLCQGKPWEQADFSPNSIDSVRLDDPKFVSALLESLPTKEQIKWFLTGIKFVSNDLHSR